MFLGPASLSALPSPLIFSRVRRCARIMYHVSCSSIMPALLLLRGERTVCADGKQQLSNNVVAALCGRTAPLTSVSLAWVPYLQNERREGEARSRTCHAMPCTANKTPNNLKRRGPASQRSKLRPPLPGLSHLASSLQAAREGRWMARRAARPDFRMYSQHLRKGHPTYTEHS